MLAVSACSTLRLGYNQGPTAAYWWLDRYVDFSEAQSPQVRQDLRQFWDWHRREALPAYATRMAQWKNLLAQDLTAEQVCREFDWVQAQLRTLGEQGTPSLARWALTLQPAQWQRIQTRFEDRNQDFAEDHIEGNAAKRLQKRFKDNQQRWADWYGDLSPTQNAVLQTQLRESPWNANTTLQERRWRQADLLATVQNAQRQPEQASALVNQHLLRYQSASNPEREAERQRWLRSGCAQFAAMHQQMSSEQRAHAQAKLQGYIDDVRALHVGKGS
jgi:hypothetical protein